MSYWVYYNTCYSSHKTDIASFYKDLNGTSFKGITADKLDVLKESSLELSKFYHNNSTPLKKHAKYAKIMNTIKTNPKKYNINSQAEKFILFMFIVDPNFEAAKIYGSYNHIDEIKLEMEKYFGFFDSKLITIENFFIKHFLNTENKNILKEEIEKRAFK